MTRPAVAILGLAVFGCIVSAAGRIAAIGAELARLGRSGVPVYALYAPGAAGPRLLGEILSVDEVLTALKA